MTFAVLDEKTIHFFTSKMLQNRCKYSHIFAKVEKIRCVRYSVLMYYVIYSVI